MILILGDMIADFSLRISKFPVTAGDLKRAEYLELGPGGATNVAIAAARLGLTVGCLGEVGDDPFGEIVLEGLQLEGIDPSGLIVSEGAETPVAGVVVDAAAEPAYLGYRGSLRLQSLPEEWAGRIAASQGLFADGWADHEAVGGVILQGLRAAHDAGVPVYFDPGPGNPEFDITWHAEAVELSTVLLANEVEANRLTGLTDPLNSALALLEKGPELIVIKRGVAGCVLLTRDQVQIAPGFPVEVKDATGAGDSLAAAVIYGYSKGLSLESLGTLANATGAVKVRKLGTGHNVPTRQEVEAILGRFGRDPADFFPPAA